MEHTDKPVSVSVPFAERLVIVSTICTIGLALTLVLDPPSVWALVVALVLTVILGADYTLRFGPDGKIRHGYEMTTLWALPTLLVVGAFLFLRLPMFNSGPAIAAGLAATGLLLGLILLSEYYVIDPSREVRNRARFWLNILSYLIAFALYTAIYAPKVRSAFSATAVAVVTALICLELYLGGREDRHRGLVYAIITGLCIGQITWALNYWIIDTLTGGALLTIAFYWASSVIRYHLSGRLSLRTLVEFSGVSSLWLVMIFFTGLWLR